MSRSGYSDDGEHIWLWRTAVARALHGRRGQRFLRRLAESLDAMPEKKLITSALSCPDGVCAMGSVAKHFKMEGVENVPEDMPDQVGLFFNIAPAMAAEIAYENDESYYGRDETEEQRWTRMRKWVSENLRDG